MVHGALNIGSRAGRSGPHGCVSVWSTKLSYLDP